MEIFVFGFVLMLLLALLNVKLTPAPAAPKRVRRLEIDEDDAGFWGSSLKIEEEQLHSILSKYCSYYKTLDPALHQRFRNRVREFIQDKKFIIRDHSGFVEMPVLIAGSAVQLTFGLKNWILPFYEIIQVMPKEYFSLNLNIVGGNVERNMITLAWTHFLDGYARKDGSHVGLHEMAHALYMQKIVVEEGGAVRFYMRFKKLEEICEKISQHEKAGHQNLFSHFADCNVQEIWAEGVERFFEQPQDLKFIYPQFYEMISKLLKQDMLNPSYPIKKPLLTFPWT